MDPEFFAALTVTVVPGTPLAQLRAKGRFEVPAVPELLRELRTMIDVAAPDRRHVPHEPRVELLAARRPLSARSRARIVGAIDAALDGKIRLRDERTRGL